MPQIPFTGPVLLPALFKPIRHDIFVALYNYIKVVNEKKLIKYFNLLNTLTALIICDNFKTGKH